MQKPQSAVNQINRFSEQHSDVRDGSRVGHLSVDTDGVTWSENQRDAVGFRRRRNAWPDPSQRLRHVRNSTRIDGRKQPLGGDHLRGREEGEARLPLGKESIGGRDHAVDHSAGKAVFST